MRDRTGGKNPAWRGGKTVDKEGYVLILRPDHPHANAAGYVREHRLIMENALGRHLLPTEVVHHKKGRAQNDPDLLVLYPSNADHLRAELTGRVPNWTEDGRRRIAEAVARQAEKQKGTKLSNETREKMRGPRRHKGRPLSPAHREALRIAALLRSARERQQKADLVDASPPTSGSDAPP